MKSALCIGLGKLGLTFSQIIAKSYKVYGYDLDKTIYENIKSNVPQSEPRLNKLIKSSKKNFQLVNNLNEAVFNTQCAFLVLPTPSKKNHEFDNKYILSSLSSIGKSLKKKKNYHIIITSTVNPGSCKIFIKYLENKFKVKHGVQFILSYNPHLIALGSIYENIMNNDLVIVGSDLKEGHLFLTNFYKKIYKNKMDKLKFLNLNEAEISKISINAYVTMKISFSNMISQISDNIENINASKILNTIGSDERVGKKYLSLGAKFAGPCFPRDNLNLIKFLKKNKSAYALPAATDNVNNKQLQRYIELFKKVKTKINGKIVVGICGLSYKDNTNLNTKSPGLMLFNKLKKDYHTITFDSLLPDNYNKLNFVSDFNIFLKKSDIIFVCYKNNRFKKIEKFKTNNKKIIIDLWNFLNIKNKNILVKKLGIS
ncbi:nucleotide sugar dehydrogenase [Candidatus Pelagibacter sp. Uisw_136]|uniref:nucleotide sugar dehydrogenase n=1 Tax=Candidatus Pelagibacter sp. Uisw_136 TaxID=3230991 RepID=UPI0039EBF794